MDFDNSILAVRATREQNGKIWLKFLAIAGGNGPGIELPDSLAKDAIECLQKVLSGESKHQIG
jgi:hypothetical protein